MLGETGDAPEGASYDVSMSQPVRNTGETGPTTVSQDLLAAALGGLLPLGAGLLMMIGYLWIDVFGAILGAGAAAAWAFWWRKKHGTFFPKNLDGKSVGGIGVLVAVLALIFAVSL
jgi:hypothetical protein